MRENDVTPSNVTVLAGDQSWPFFFFVIPLYLVTETLCLVILRV